MKSGDIRRTSLFVVLLFGAVAASGCAAGPGPSDQPAPEPERAEAAQDAAPAGGAADQRAAEAEAARARAEEPRRAGAEAGLTERPTELEPSEAVLRTSRNVELTGHELGRMWTFENPPLEYWEEEYGFRPDSAWLEHVRLASVRYAEFCSASFVSPNGLVMTNHHCARSCVEAASQAGEDLVVNGFYAPTREDERVCPGVFLDQLISIDEVTRMVEGAVPPGATDVAAAEAERAATDSISAACEAETGLICQVVSLYHGGQYQLYRYRRYEPVKLVFAPELQAGFYGGDPDNFTYPRYALDVSFVRAYRPDSTTAVSTDNWFAWDPAGAEEGELVFITGNPGGTSRLATVSQVLFEQQARHPFIVQLLEGRVRVLEGASEGNPQRARALRGVLFGLSNSLKAYSGQLGGLRDTLLLGRKVLWERQFRERVMADPELGGRYAGAWERMAEIQRQKVELYPAFSLYNPDLVFPSPHLQLAAHLVNFVREVAKPVEERLPAYQPPRLVRVREQLMQDRPLDDALGAALLAVRLRLASQWLAEDAPLLGAAMRPGESVEEAARRLVAGSRIGDTSFRRGLMEEGPSALAGIEDPLIELAALMTERHRELAARWEELGASESVQEERLAEALFAVFGTQIPPDATFTLRISDGVVRRYPYNGTFAPAWTTMYGMYNRAAGFEGEMPWTLPETFEERREFVDMATPLNFVATTDITGGNSGSPMIDREARVVGIAFDGNIEQLPNEFLFRTRAARTVAVHASGILEALSSVYQAMPLVQELREASAPGAAGGG